MKTDAERDTSPHKQLTLFDKGLTFQKRSASPFY